LDRAIAAELFAIGRFDLGTGEVMNRSLFIILVPALLVAAGYIFILRMMGIPPGYPRLITAMVLFFGAIYWLARRSNKNVKGG
jgi:hypothetical protein